MHVITSSVFCDPEQQLWIPAGRDSVPASKTGDGQADGSAAAANSLASIVNLRDSGILRGALLLCSILSLQVHGPSFELMMRFIHSGGLSWEPHQVGGGGE